MKRVGSVLAVAAWVAAVVGGMVLVRAVPAAAPPLTLSGLRLWAAQQAPGDTLLWLLRAPVLVGGWYALAVTALGVGARWARLRPLRRLADAVTLPPLRRFLDAAVGATVTLVAVAGPAGAATVPAARAAPATAPSPPPVLRPYEEPSSTIPAYEDDPGTPPAPTGDEAPDDTTPGDPGPGDPRLGDTGPVAPLPDPDAGPPLPPPLDSAPATTTVPTTTTLTSPPTPAAVAAAPAPAPAPGPAPATVSAPAPPLPAAAATASTWTVRPGDNFWRVAERLLSGSYRRHPSVPEVARYWRTFIEANRRNLVHPGDPSLVFPGQVLAVPPVAEPGP